MKDGRVQRKNYRDVSPRGPLEIRIEAPRVGYRHVVTRELLERFVELIPDWQAISRRLELIVLADGNGWSDGRYEAGVVELSAWPDPPEITVGPIHHAVHRPIWERLGVPSRPKLEFIAVVPYWGDDEVRDMVENEIRGNLRIIQAVDGETEGEWLAVECDEVPGTILAEITLIEWELHIYERCVSMRFDRRTAAAYQLLHVFLHELGHHVDAMALPDRGVCKRGENYAEHWANRTAERIWDDAVALICG